MISQTDISKARENFMIASEYFGFKFHSPFALTDELTVFGYIENYGSKNGAVICLFESPNYEIDKKVISWCKEMDCFYSFIDIEPLLGGYSTSYFREMLRDWGKY